MERVKQPSSSTGKIVTLADETDKKGIRFKVISNAEKLETTVFVHYNEVSRHRTIPSNRWGFHIETTVKCLKIAEAFAQEIEKECGL